MTDKTADKERKESQNQKDARKIAMDWYASKLPSFLGGNVVKEKRKHKEKLEKSGY